MAPRGGPLAVDDAERLLARARRHLDFHRPVAVASSSAVGVPTLIGWWRPLVVLPSALLDRVPDEELECLLIHELAHVQRADVAWNWLQVLVEVALFFHPAARWLARQVRHERECCCDAWVPPRQADLVAYVRALTRLAAADRAAASPALSASGGTLVNRIERLVDPTAARPTCSLGFCLTLVLGAVAGGATLWLCDVEECPVPLEVEATAEQQLAAATPAEENLPPAHR
ncbi:M56 family metallopeptidase [Nannocystis pusilla]|uniref:M56 family metallopeptidase n=1 Tax=Nannocystis pusilla TaxID=889268 RepID=UPI003B78B8E1